MSYRVSGYIRTALQWQFHAQVAVWAIKTLLVQVPEPEIFYPAGVELTLALTKPFTPAGPLDPALLPDRFTYDERSKLADLVEQLPRRTSAVTNRPADLINVAVIGSRAQVAKAFEAAGWVQAHPITMRSTFLGIRAVAASRGYMAAPMSPLLLGSTEADLSLQKSLNDVSKRDHIRLWKQGRSWKGQEVWAGAATRDIDYAYLRRGGMFTHKIEANVDNERDKVAHDLAFTTCADVLDWSDPRAVPRFSHNATGDPMKTDTRLAVIQLNACESPRMSTEAVEETPVRASGTKFYRFARREVLSVRSDLLRTNPYWRSFEGARWIVQSIRHRPRGLEPGTF